MSGLWLLALGLGVTVVWVGLRLGWGYARPERPLEILHAGEYAFLAAVAEASLPPGGAPAPSGTEAGIPEYVDRYLTVLPRRLRRLMRALFFLLEHGTLLFPAGGLTGMRRFTCLPPTSRTRYLDGWRRSRLYARRLAFTSLRSVLGMAYLAHPAVQRDLGIAPLRIASPVCEADLLWPPIGQPPEAIRYTRENLDPPSSGEPLDPDGPLHPAFEESTG
ncbi:MAG: hypothetical protein ACE5FG_02825 [Myxococcota bacterium]